MKDEIINRFTEKKIIYFFFACFLIINNVKAQKFTGSAVWGINLAQIDGDALYGYSKLGWTGGFKIGYPIAKNTNINMEMLYSQRGSTSGFGFGSNKDIFTDLKYISLPIYVNYNDWYIEDQKYYKVGIHAGLSSAKLFDIKSSNGVFSNNIDNYTPYSFSYIIGVNYAFTSKISTTIRYTRDINSLYTVTAIGYFITLRMDYKF
ncbi:MAG: outer membrane beta-barrel protein [Saprospiraceae bacterium]